MALLRQPSLSAGAVGVYPCALACVKAIAHVGSHWINITYCINTVEALDWTQPWKPRGKKAERGRRSAPLLSLLQIRFPLKEQRQPNNLPPVRHKRWLSRGGEELKAFCLFGELRMQMRETSTHFAGYPRAKFTQLVATRGLCWSEGAPLAS